MYIASLQTVIKLAISYNMAIKFYFFIQTELNIPHAWWGELGQPVAVNHWSLQPICFYWKSCHWKKFAHSKLLGVSVCSRIQAKFLYFEDRSTDC